MSSHARSRRREDERRLSIRTLVIASIASATAAIVTSYFWRAGTPIAAAITPVIVTLVSEMLHRPTERLAERFTAEGTAVLPEAGGPAPPVPPSGVPPPPERQTLPDQAPAEPGSEPESGTADRRPAAEGAAPVRVYKPQGRRRRIAIGAVAATAALAFVIAAVALTATELIADEPLGKGGGKTTFFGGRDRDRGEDRQQEAPPAQTQPTEEEEQPPQETTTDDQDEPQPKEGAAPPRRQQTTTQQTTPTQPPPGRPPP